MVQTGNSSAVADSSTDAPARPPRRHDIDWLRVELPMAAEYALIALASLGVSLGFYLAVIRPVGALRFLFGVKTRRAG